MTQDNCRNATSRLGLEGYGGGDKAHNAPPAPFHVAARHGIDARLECGNVLIRQIQPGQDASLPPSVTIDHGSLVAFHRWLSGIVPRDSPTVAPSHASHPHGLLAGLEEARGRLVDIGDYRLAGLVADAVSWIKARAE